MFICSMSDKFVQVRYKNRTYHFEHTAWAGWVPTTKDFMEPKRNHPKGAWLELKRIHDPDIII